MALINYQKKLLNNGMVLLNNYFNNVERNMVINWANYLQNLPETKNKWMTYNETNTNAKTRMEYFVKYHKPVYDFVHYGLTPLVNNISGENMVLFKDKINWKLPNTKGFAAHQDHLAWNNFSNKKFITVALFADDTNEDNGCLEFVENKHNEGIFEHDLETTGALSKDIEKSFDWKPVNTTTYDVLLFDSYIPHRSGPNISDMSRRIFYFTYSNLEDGDLYEEYNRIKRLEFPPVIERDPSKEYNNLGTRFNLANPIN